MRLLLALLASFPLLAPGGFWRAPGPDLRRAFFAWASWYGPGFDGRHTASGVVFRRGLPIVAHRFLPFGTRVMIRRGTRWAQGIVLDRGPFVRGRAFDLSQALADRLGILEVGKAVLEIRVLDVLPPEEWEASLVR